MRLLPVNMLKPGMRLGKRIYNEEGLTLLGEQIELTDRIINRLSEYGLDFVYIQDPRTNDLTVEDVISEQTRRKAITEIRTTFRKMMEDDIRRKAVGSLRLGNTFNKLVTDLVDEISSQQDAMMMLTNMGVMDSYLFQHSLNVCIYSLMLGMSYGYNKNELMTLGFGAMLHDIGKTQIPLSILQKKEELTDEEYSHIQKHAMFGYEFLKEEPNIPLLSAHCALQHHERIDGSGYPQGLKGEKILDYARWIGIVDSFDAMITHRVYRRAMLPHQAMERLYVGSGTLYDKKKLELFRDRIAIYPLGITVTLNTGESGIVTDINRNVPHRPIIRILQDADGQELRQPYEIDLAKKLNLIITAVNGEDRQVDAYSSVAATSSL